MPLVGACGKLRRCEPVSEARVRSECVVVGPPCFDDPACLRQTKRCSVVLVAQPAIELSVIRFLDRHVDAMWCPFRPRSSCQARLREVSSVPLSLTTMQGVSRISMAQSSSRTTRRPEERVVHDQRHTFPAEVIHHGQHPELAARSQCVGHEVGTSAGSIPAGSP